MARGSHRGKYPLRPEDMVTACRYQGAKIRQDVYGFVMLAGEGKPEERKITTTEAARRLEEQADRWEAEVRTGVPNHVDRIMIGE